MIGSSSQGSGSSSRSRSHGMRARPTNRIRAGKLPQWCGCGMHPVLRWSGTNANPERPFLGCPNYNTTGKRWCGLFVWADEEEETIVGRVDSARDVDHWKMNLSWTIRDLEADVRV
ncbi:Zinc finger GRF-type protein [Arachis hypogaea]|nr:Zinc finger GRF-type protein [Arachis hypogaea]